MTDAFLITNCAISLIALTLIWFGPFAALRRDNFRADIRRLRDELFDFMWQNDISYKDPAYQTTRQTLNGMLRLANRLSPFAFIVALWYFSKMKNVPQGCTASNKALQKKIDQIVDVAVRRMLRFVFLEGTLGLTVKLVQVLFQSTSAWVRLVKYFQGAAYSLAGELADLGAPAANLSISQRHLLRC